ncbi:MAG: polysaccharide deacetylase family protein [Methanomicrobia archaeon]|nr:polysaccharide deacetylase family protein [Methanomicrobia archaeon]
MMNVDTKRVYLSVKLILPLLVMGVMVSSIQTPVHQKPNSPIIMIVTVDWEVGNEEALRDTIPDSTRAILRLFKKHDIKATFLAECDSIVNMFEYEDLVNEILADGHEIGFHFHLICWLQTETQMKTSIEYAKEEAGRYNIDLKSFRAGCFEITPKYLELLKEAGFHVDLSEREGTPHWLNNGMLELPLTHLKKWHILNYYLNFYNRDMEKIVNEKYKDGTDIFVLYFHQWNIVKDEKLLNYMDNFFSYIEKKYNVKYITCKEAYRMFYTDKENNDSISHGDP